MVHTQSLVRTFVPLLKAGQGTERQSVANLEPAAIVVVPAAHAVQAALCEAAEVAASLK